MCFDRIAIITMFGLVLGSILILGLLKKRDLVALRRRMFLPFTHEYAVKKWIDNELTHTVQQRKISVKFTQPAVAFIRARYPKDVSLQIILRYRFYTSRAGSFWEPNVDTRLGTVDPHEDFIRVDSNSGIPVFMAKEIYEVLKQENILLTVTTSGLWKYRKLKLKPNLSWLLYTKEMREKTGRHYPR